MFLGSICNEMLRWFKFKLEKLSMFFAISTILIFIILETFWTIVISFMLFQCSWMPDFLKAIFTRIGFNICMNQKMSLLGTFLLKTLLTCLSRKHFFICMDQFKIFPSIECSEFFLAILMCMDTVSVLNEFFHVL